MLCSTLFWKNKFVFFGQQRWTHKSECWPQPRLPQAGACHPHRCPAAHPQRMQTPTQANVHHSVTYPSARVLSLSVFTMDGFCMHVTNLGMANSIDALHMHL